MSLSTAEIRHALDQQIDYTGQLQREIDRLQLEADRLRGEVREREAAQAELESTLRAVRKLVQ